jgi:choline-sulfatase
MTMQKKPNILLITSDQLQATAIGCYGNPDVKTPNIDRLAESGVRFVHGISNSPVCMPGRSVLMSGQHNRCCTGGIANVHYYGGKPGSYPMPEYPGKGRLHFPETTFPEILKANGYNTAVIGKWHIYPWPDVIGFDYYLIPRTHHVHSNQLYTENGGSEINPNGWSVEFETDRASQYIKDSSDDEPFFLCLNYSPPHPPINDCPEKYLKMYEPNQLTLRKNVDEHSDFPGDYEGRVYNWDYRYYELELPYTLQPMDFNVRQLYADYYGNVTWLDDNIGRIMQALKESGKLEDTIVVFTADHGDNLGSHNRGGKGLPYDEAINIPMIYSQQGTIDSRVDEEQVAGLLDVAPTLLNMVGIVAPEHFFGTDVFNDKSDLGIVEVHPGDIAARTCRFTAHLKIADEVQRLAFFDNQEDPFQMENLVGTEAYSEEQDNLFALLENYHNEVAIMPPPDYGFMVN